MPDRNSDGQRPGGRRDTRPALGCRASRHAQSARQPDRRGFGEWRRAGSDGCGSADFGFPWVTVGAVACAGTLAAVFLGWEVSHPVPNSTAHSSAGATRYRKNVIRAKRTPDKKIASRADGTTRETSEATKWDGPQVGLGRRQAFGCEAFGRRNTGWYVASRGLPHQPLCTRRIESRWICSGFRLT